MEQTVVKTTDLRVNDAQMRTRCSVDKMVQLAISIKAAGLDPTQPIIVATAENGARPVISGHRRWLAFMLATLMKKATKTEAEKVIEKKLKPQDGFIPLADDLYYDLAREVDVEIPVQVFQGDPEEEILTLLRAGGGAEEPDLLGLSHAFAVAVSRGIGEKRLAANNGLPLQRVRAIIALGQLNPKIAQLIQDGRLGLGVCRPLLELPPAKRAAMTEALLEQVEKGYEVATNRAKEAARQLAAYQGPQITLEDSPKRRNTARAMHAVWNNLLEEDEVAPWQVAAKKALQSGDIPNVGDWMIDLDDPDNRQFSKDGKWYRPELDLDKLAEHLPEATCETCVLQALPEKRLRNDLELPCRKKSFRGNGCLHHISEADSFYVVLPWTWYKEDTREMTSMKDLLAAWKRQERRERREQRETKDVKAQRDMIQRFMECHARSPFDAAHPWATTCATCRWHLDQSPTKNPDVPHCQWADRKRNVTFLVRVPQEGEPGKPIPYCRQYGPANDNWNETIPESDQPLSFPRPVIQWIMEYMDNDVHSYDRGSLEFMVGRPMRSKDSPRRWKELLKERIGDLSDGQLQTLFIWIACDWTRVGGYSRIYPIPVRGKFAFYREARLDQFFAENEQP